jgi:hypothetical protein
MKVQSTLLGTGVSIVSIFLAQTSIASNHDVPSSYVFNPQELNRIGQQANEEVGRFFKDSSPAALRELAIQHFEQSHGDDPDLVEAYRTEVVADRIYDLLKEKHPDKILDHSQWIWNNVGGIYARMKILYCSLNEYIALFGTIVPQTGFSGEYSQMDVYDIMYSGEMKSHNAKSEGALPVTYRAGDVSLLSKNETRVYTMDKFTYMIDYGRGNITPSLWQGVIAPFLFVNHDSHSFKTQLKDCGESILKNILN